MTQRKRQYDMRLRNPQFPTSAYVAFTARAEKVNHKLESLQLSRKDQVYISRLKSRRSMDLKYWLNKIGRALDTVCRKCGLGRRQLNKQCGSGLESTTLQPDFKDVTCNGFRARSQDLEQSFTTNNCTDGLSSDPPPCNPASKILPDCDELTKALELWEVWKAKPDLPEFSQPGQLT